MTKCDCCGIIQEKTGSVNITFGTSEPIKADTYNIQIFEYVKGRNICENCMEIYTYIETLFGNMDIARGGLQYYCDGRELTKIINKNITRSGRHE